MKRVSCVVTIVLIALALSEVTLRWMGHAPWSPYLHGEVLLTDKDPVIGWMNRPDTHTEYSPSGRDTVSNITIWPNRARKTRPDLKHDGPVLGLFGCSFLHGWILPDEETIGWQLQELVPEMNVLNFGTPGYGTFQSLMFMEEVIRSKTQKLQNVTYVFHPHHGMRNVNHPDWLLTLALVQSDNNILIPYVDIDQSGMLRRHSPEGYLNLPFRHSSALITLVELAFAKQSARYRIEQELEVTKRLMLEMNTLVSKHDSSFSVVLIGSSQDSAVRGYLEFLKERAVSVIDCRHPEYGSPEMTLPNDTHPNAQMASYIADCIHRGLTVLPNK